MTIIVKSDEKVYDRVLATRIDNRATANTVIAEWAAKPAAIGLTKNSVQNTKVNAACFAFNELGKKFVMCNIISGKYYKTDYTILTKMNSIVDAVIEDSTLLSKHSFDTSGDAEGAEDDTISTFSVDFSSEIGTPKDAFHHVFQNKKVILRGYTQTNTLTKVETWADSKEVLA